jgi:DtxR family Mn-dependent transcriptional regulator
MPLKAKENYLKTMYMIDEERGVISLSELGKRLGVSVPTVNSMAKRLHDDGWVIYEKYKPVRLTSQGKKEAALIIRRHRIVEMFLVEKMKFGWEEVHEIAEEMEHVDSEALFERMDEVLGRPAFDPHGSPIPDKNGNIASSHYLRLSETKEGDKVSLKALYDDNREFLNFLNSKKLALGVQITVGHIEPFDGSMTVTYNSESAVTLSREVCERLFVEPLNVKA